MIQLNRRAIVDRTLQADPKKRLRDPTALANVTGDIATIAVDSAESAMFPPSALPESSGAQ